MVQPLERNIKKVGGERMEIGAKTIKRIVTSTVDKPVTTDSIYYIGEVIEKIIRESAVEAGKLHDEINSLRKIQGLREKSRINEEIFRKIYERIKYSKVVNT